MMETGVILPNKRDNDCASHTENSMALLPLPLSRYGLDKEQ